MVLLSAMNPACSSAISVGVESGQADFEHGFYKKTDEAGGFVVLAEL